jgi:predicted Zn-dependent peptidase
MKCGALFLALFAGCAAAPRVSVGPTRAELAVPSAPTPTKPGGAAGAQPPPALEAKESAFPVVRRTTLPNGLGVAVIESHALPIVHLRVVVRAGAGYGPIPGSIELTAKLLKDGGTRTMTSAELLRRIETLGADLSIDIDFDSTVLHTAITKEHLAEALTLLGEVTTEPRFDDVELKKLKARETDGAEEAARASGQFGATRAMFSELYAQGNPYSRYGLVPAEIAKVTSATVRDVHKRFFVPKNAEVIVAGDVDEGSARAAVEKAFGRWKGGEPPTMAFPPSIPIAKRRVLVANRPKSAQSDVFVAMAGPARQTPDWPEVRVALQVLGGGTASRLFSDVREQRSLAYSVYARVQELANGEQPLIAYAGTQTGKTVEAVQGLIDNLQRIETGPISDSETETARGYLSDVFAIRMATIGSIADMLVTQDVLGFKDGYWDDYRRALRAVEARQATAAAKKIFHPDRALVVVAGDADIIAAPLARYGEVTIVDPEHEFKTTKTLPAQ